MSGSINYRTADIPELLSDINVKLLLKLVEQHPEWPITLFVGQHPSNKNSKKRRFTLEDASVILKRLQLVSKSQRQTYALYNTHVQSLADLQPIDYDRVAMATLLSDTRAQRLLELASAYPHLASTQLVSKLPKNMKGVPILTYAQVKIILGRLKLATIADRMQRMGLSEEPTKPPARQTIPQALTSLSQYTQYKHQEHTPTETKPEKAQPLLHVEPAPPPVIKYTPTQQATFKQYDRFFSLMKQFALTALFSFLFFFTGSFLLSMLFHAQGIVQRIGLFFSFSALFFGLFFFLYSLKYYVIIVVMLSFSRADLQEQEQRRGIGGFLSRLFGISITIEDTQAAAGNDKPHKPTISLQYDLSQVTLERTPFVSIHVATYNEKRVIDRFLLAATSMEYDNYEVIVADDSTDETVQLLEQWKAHPKVKISHRETRNGYKGAALAQALTQVDPRTEFLLVFDADFIPYPDAITQFLKYFQAMLGDLKPETIKNTPIAAVQGYQWHILNRSENWITRGVRSEYAGSYVIERSVAEVLHGLKQISGSVYMVRKDALASIGWGTSITEDFELTLRLYEHGYKVVYTPYIQAPAEAVSTVKRLIKQRMRWAEGHSFNVKRMFTKLLTSPNLTFSEKCEFLYLSPYYLQAFFFILGTMCWFIAESVLHTRLPFWTEVWGWSLVLTNLFALPLMNLVGLFMEEAVEQDYLGLFSFLILSYIVAPFQAFAAVKGFLEKEEGPWFRTPKTGRITDSFVPGRFYRFVKGMFGKNAPTQTSAFSPSQLGKFSFAFASTTNQVPPDSSRRPKGMRWSGNTILAVFLIATILLNYLAFFTSLTKVHAAGNPTIEQQINMFDFGSQSSGGTNTGIIYIDPSVYSGTSTYYFEVDAKVSSGTGTVTLTYDAGTTDTPSGGSTIQISNITATSATRFRSSAFTPTGGNAYVSATSGTGITVFAARIVIVQTDATSINNTLTQIAIGTGNFTTTNTTDTPPSNPKMWTWDGTKYDGTVSVYFEAAFNNATAGQTSTFSLYTVGAGNTCGTQVSGSAVSATGTTYVRERTSSTISLSNSTSYLVCGNTTSGGTAQLIGAKIIVKQTSSGLSKMELQHMYTNTANSNAVNTFKNIGNFNQYDPSDWAGGTFTYYFEAVIKAAGGTTATAQLFDNTAGSAISSSQVSTSNASVTLVRTSTTITPPSSAHDLVAQLEDSATSTASSVGNWLIIDVSSLQTPENVLPFLPLAIFLPQAIQYWQRRRKGKVVVLK